MSLLDKLSGKKEEKITGNHYEIIGFKPEEESIMDLIGDVASKAENPKKVKRDNVEYTILEKNYGPGIGVLVFVDDKGSIHCSVPAFKGKYKQTFEVSNVIPTGCGNEGIIEGFVKTADGSKCTVCFSPANFLEANVWKLKRGDKINARIAGLCYSLEAFKPKSEKKVMDKGPMKGEEVDFGFMGYIMPANMQSKEHSDKYLLRGEILEVETLKNSMTSDELLRLHIDTKTIKLEILANKKYLVGDAKIGNYIFARVWLQGYVEGNSNEVK